MKYAQLRTMDVANGEGIRVSLFASGCTHNCKGCFNKLYQDFNYGNNMDFEVVDDIITLLSRKQYKGLTLLGGEPFQNLELVKFLLPIREFIDKYNSLESVCGAAKKDIWVYSGYTLEQILLDNKKTELLKLADVLVDGLFVENLLNLKLKFRGSSNQRILDVKKSINENKAVYYYGEKDI